MDELNRTTRKSLVTDEGELTLAIPRFDLGVNGLGRVYDFSTPASAESRFSRITFEQYDAMGRVKHKTTEVDGLEAAKHEYYRYNLAGQLIRHTQPNGVHVQATFGNSGGEAEFRWVKFGRILVNLTPIRHLGVA